MSAATKWQRLSRVARHRRLDGRLPQGVQDLIKPWLSLRLRRAGNALVAAVFPRSIGGNDVERSDGRSWIVSGDPPCSLHDLAHENASLLLDALQAGGVEPFLIDANGLRLAFGIRIEHRRVAWRAVQSLNKTGGWYVDWRRGGRTKTLSFSARRTPRSLRRAEWWRIYRRYRVGQHSLVGRDQAVELSFWAPGSEGHYERVGVRGHHRFPADAVQTSQNVDGRTYPGLLSFPVGRSLTRFNEPIDVVYTWVDGSDPAWQADFEHWAARSGSELIDDRAAHQARYRSRDELRYSLRSLWLYAGWIRRVFVVTAGQVPAWLVPDERLQVVHHRDIIPEDRLPTFNSHAIEARLHHIDGLSEYFLYLNDDMFFGKVVTPQMFFTANGLGRFFESEARVPLAASDLSRLSVNAAALNGQKIIEELFGRIVERKLLHAPYALRRSVLFEIEKRLPEVVERTTRARFRHPDDLSIPSAFAHHYGFCTGRSIPGELDVGYQNIESRRLRLFLERVLLGRDLSVFCLNETEAEQADPATVDTMLADFLEAYFSTPCPWEQHKPATGRREAAP